MHHASLFKVLWNAGRSDNRSCVCGPEQKTTMRLLWMEYPLTFQTHAAASSAQIHKRSGNRPLDTTDSVTLGCPWSWPMGLPVVHSILFNRILSAQQCPSEVEVSAVCTDEGFRRRRALGPQFYASQPPAELNQCETKNASCPVRENSKNFPCPRSCQSMPYLGVLACSSAWCGSAWTTHGGNDRANVDHHGVRQVQSLQQAHRRRACRGQASKCCASVTARRSRGQASMHTSTGISRRSSSWWRRQCH